MAKINIKFDTKKFEKQLQKQIDEITQKKQKELLIQRRKENEGMYVLNSNEETMLEIFINKYNNNKNYQICGTYDEFPDYMKFSIKKTMESLKYAGLISNFNNFITGEWNVILTPDALQYYNRKGSRTELFNELAKSDKELLKEIIDIDDKNENISEFLGEKVTDDPKDINRGIIRNLSKNGLLTVSWASDTVYYASLTQNGRTYFEREKEYNKKIQDMRTSKIYNIGTITAQNSNLFVGDVFDSNIEMSNTISKIENEIENKCDTEEEKELLKALLEEAKEIIDNYKESNRFDIRKGFFKKLTEHLDKHGWFYAEIANLIGQTVLMKISGQI